MSGAWRQEQWELFEFGGGGSIKVTVYLEVRGENRENCLINWEQIDLFTLRWQMNTENCLSWGGKWEQRELFTMRWEEQVGLFTFSIGGENRKNSLPWAWEERTEGTVYLVVGGENRGVYLEVEDENIQKSLPWNGRWQRIKLYLEIRDENTQLFPLR